MCRSRSAAVDRCSLHVPEGTVYGLLGPNGAGKSTLLGLIANRLVPTSGRIFVDGEPAADNARALAKLYCMNDKKMYPENLRLDNLFKEMGRFYEGFDRTAAAGFAEAFGLDLRKKIGSLSTGYRSIYQLVVGLSLDVDYLLLDEPVLGLDANHRELFYKLLLDDYLEKQRTVIIATHLIEEVANLVEQVTVIDHGRVLLQASSEELRASGYSVSGRAADVDAYCEGREVLGIDELGGLKVADALSAEKADSIAATTYANILAVRAGDENRPELKALINALKSDQVKEFMTKKYEGAVVPAN